MGVRTQWLTRYRPPEFCATFRKDATRVVHEISLAPLTVLELDALSMIACAARNGYDYVGLRLVPPGQEEPPSPIVGDKRLTRELRMRSDDLGVPILDIEVLRLRPGTDVEREYAPVLETAALLGASHILCTANDPDRSRLIENFGELVRLAASHGLTADLEFMIWTDVADLSAAVDVIRAVDNPSAGILIDCLHWNRADCALSDLAELPSEWFNYLQICDAPERRPTDLDALLFEARSSRLLPGDGSLDIMGPLRLLRDNVPVSVEVPTTLPRLSDPEIRARVAAQATRAVLDRV
ncbi:MAG: endonuclease [Pseudonocardiales bacterium]|nr:endonuclease [Pseudonocardiales bacterium]